ncbi:MAG: GatB/YqeY domain-containing protein [Gammaproteobacteria bacterium]|nr:GatB/YqeY domain-containing protein [Gammaproteobacteria bacterium]
MSSQLKAQVTADMKTALRGGEKLRLSTIRMLLAAVKQREVDERREMTDADLLQIVEKLIKQRREAAGQFATAGRTDLETRELDEVSVLEAYLPAPLDETEIAALLEATIAATGAAGPKDMGKVMNALRPQIQGRADMSRVSALVKARLAG